MAGTANPNPGARVPYPSDAYAGAEAPRARPVGAGRRAPDDDEVEDEPTGTSPWLWISALLALAILALAAFLVFRLLSGGEPTPGPNQVEVPNFVGMTYDDAQAAAEDAGLELVIRESRPSDQADNTVIEQDPEAGATADEGSTVQIVLDLGEETVAVPDLRAKTENEALTLIFGAKLTPGTRTEEFDDLIPIGSIISQEPGAGQIVTQGLPINYVVSKGPEPTPTPSPSPTPSPTPAPTPPPTEPPTPPPTPEPVTVGDYVCKTVGEARVLVESADLVFKVLPSIAPDAWFVADQDPAAGSSVPPGSQVTVSAVEIKPLTCP